MKGGLIVTLSAEARAARAKYMREWRRRNPDKQREYNARKWEYKAAKIRLEREKGAVNNEPVQSS